MKWIIIMNILKNNKRINLNFYSFYFYYKTELIKINNRVEII